LGVNAVYVPTFIKGLIYINTRVLPRYTASTSPR